MKNEPSPWSGGEAHDPYNGVDWASPLWEEMTIPRNDISSHVNLATTDIDQLPLGYLTIGPDWIDQLGPVAVVMTLTGSLRLVCYDDGWKSPRTYLGWRAADLAATAHERTHGLRCAHD
jgi:hypothetical protein